MKIVKTTFQEINDAPDESSCPRCNNLRTRVWTATRFAIDASTERQGLLKIVIGVYRCSSCSSYFRSNPKFIRPRFLYTNKIINAAVAAAIEDKMPISRIPHRLERDFGVKPAESVIRDWIEKAAADTVVHDVLPVAIREFSGVLCIDEAYSGKLAIIVAVDPKNNDRLIGFDLSENGIDQDRVKAFLDRLKKFGIMPHQVITDGSALYPEVVKEVWQGVHHQLCLFHVTQRLTALAKNAIRDLKKQLPRIPASSGGKATKDDVAAALTLFKSGVSKHQIAKKLGVSRNSIKVWLKNPDLVADRYGIDSKSILPQSNLEAKISFNKSSIVRQSPPDGWNSWEQVENVDNALKKLAFHISSRKLYTDEKLSGLYSTCLISPFGKRVRNIRAFIDAWYGIFTDGLTAPSKWQGLREANLAPECIPFKNFQKQMNDSMFEKLSTVFKNENFEKTSNGTARFAGKIKRIQKSRYRLRTGKSIRKFILVERLLHGEGLTHGDMETPFPFRSRFR